ncbi:hypothetical protein CERZMDRAFT_89528 [Cercospora zeae-maydis SCOH1-5]|uniref:Uncharacterized protein n=1 Tax=Cercospora zeae-maydis SCOH1-5 TaxID=717836 RepID=A0A6A6FVT1_9PEZI|nr:hypothetical protein CERZMDRAFT_89528 [Cercospora zeae-maydis SCOH1-5]
MRIGLGFPFWSGFFQELVTLAEGSTTGPQNSMETVRTNERKNSRKGAFLYMKCSSCA